MTDYNPKDPNDVSGTETMLKLPPVEASTTPDKTDAEAITETPKPKRTGKKKTATKKPKVVATKTEAQAGTELTQPQSIDDAIAAGMKPKDLDDLVKAWGKYNLQEAARQAKATTEALANSVQARRRKIFDELLKIADDYGLTPSEAKKAFEKKRASRADSQATGK